MEASSDVRAAGEWTSGKGKHSQVCMRPRGEGTDDRGLGQSAEDTSCPGTWGTARCRATSVILRQVTRLTKISAWWDHELGELLRRRAGRACGRGAARCSASPDVESHVGRSAVL